MSDKLKLPFPLLADADHKVIDSYRVFDPTDGIAIPSTFVIDRKGIVKWIYLGKDRADRPPDRLLFDALAKAE